MRGRITPIHDPDFTGLAQDRSKSTLIRLLWIGSYIQANKTFTKQESRMEADDLVENYLTNFNNKSIITKR